MGNVMTKDSCISFPPKDKLIIIRQSLVEICANATAYKSADPQCAAAILQYFIYRTDGKLDQISEYKTEVEIARKSKQDAPPIPELWIFKTQDELYQDDLLAHFGRNTVVYSLRWLVEVSPYLSERNNPKYSWDKTKQYRVNVEAIQSEIDSLPVNTASFTDKLSNTSQVNNGEFEDKPAIPEYTTKKEQSKKESAVAALGDVPEKIVDNSPVKEKKQKPKKQEKTEQDQLFEIIALGSFGKPYPELNGNSARAGKIRKEILKLKPDITPEYLKAGYQLYLKENPDIKHNPKNRLKSPMAIIDKCEQAYDLANRGKPTPKAPEQVIIPADYVAPDLKAISKRIEEEYRIKRELERGQQSK